MVGEGEASKLKNRHFLEGSGHLCSIFHGHFYLFTCLAMSGELKAVENFLSYQTDNPLELFSSKMTFFSFRVKNIFSNFLTCSAKMAPTTHGYFVLRFSQLILALLTWPNA